jgi:3-phenylpropionate/cinnamic acid dioxygenase small subunit
VPASRREDERRKLAADLVNREAHLLDAQDWDAWLALYEEDAEFWVPTWRDEAHLITDPSCELSFIFMRGRRSLEERILRLTSGRSSAALPLCRTCHLVAGPIVAVDGEGASDQVKSSWVSHVYRHKDGALVTYAGRYEHELRWNGGYYRILRKKVILINDRLMSLIDFFYV